MSMQSSGGGGSGLLTVCQNVVTAINALVQATLNKAPQGTFTMAAAATLAVPQANIKATSAVNLSPTNAAAGTLQGSAKCLYISVITPGTGFTVATSSGASAAGTETFSYSVETP